MLDIGFLREANLATDPSYEGGVTVPALIDVASGQVVTRRCSTGLTGSRSGSSAPGS